jgi:glycosyltransferase involved in cell wall biosynthesis
LAAVVFIGKVNKNVFILQIFGIILVLSYCLFCINILAYLSVWEVSLPLNDAKHQKVSLIIPCRNEKDLLSQTVSSIMISQTTVSFELIIVDDGSLDGCCDFLKQMLPSLANIKLIRTANQGAANARNLGAKQAIGDIFIFCDAHINVPDFWLDHLVAPFHDPLVHALVPGIGAVDQPQAVGYGGTWDAAQKWCWLGRPTDKDIFEVPFAPGGCVAIRATTFHTIGGFDPGTRVWGYEDQEISLKLWLFGYTIFATTKVSILHVFRKKHPYQVGMVNLLHNLLRMNFLHLSTTRINKSINLLKEQYFFNAAITAVVLSNVWHIRKRYLLQRKFDDDWFFEKFNIPF